MCPKLLYTGLLTLLLLPSCTPESDLPPNDPEKIKFSLDTLDEEGLLGPAGGKRALTYEFCIPPGKEEEVAAIDKTAQFMHTSGRVGCSKAQLLCLGHTHQPDYKRVLRHLSSLEYVKEIREAFFE